MERVCPKCGLETLQWDEVDIGVGIQRGPAFCVNPDCGWDLAKKERRESENNKAVI